jgi:hypothetical protein
MRKTSAKDNLRAFFLANIGVVVNANQRQAVAGDVSEWARRVRELRDEQGWPILTHNDITTLKPGHCLLGEAPLEVSNVAAKRGLQAEPRVEVLDRDGCTCQMCGLAPGERDPDTECRVRLSMGHIVEKRFGGSDELANLRALCSSCNQGAKNVTFEKPTGVWLLSQIRRAGREEQRAAYSWL